VLRRNGWTLIRTKGSHQTFLSPDGARLVTVPVHNKDPKPGTQKAIMRRAGLKDADL
jgi:predicted RNA binding protein YcfA (HicA-like mRNA interferase family)